MTSTLQMVLSNAEYGTPQCHLILTPERETAVTASYDSGVGTSLQFEKAAQVQLRWRIGVAKVLTRLSRCKLGHWPKDCSASHAMQDPVASGQVILIRISSSRGNGCGKERENGKAAPSSVWRTWTLRQVAPLLRQPLVIRDGRRLYIIIGNRRLVQLSRTKTFQDRTHLSSQVVLWKLFFSISGC